MPKSSKSTPLVTLHLSDIHFGQEKGKGEAHEVNKDARDQLVRKVREIAQARAAAHQPPMGSIIITGDIAYSGQAKQYAEAFDWLTQVSAAAGCDPLSIQVVPGNHDVDRGKSPMVHGMLEKLFRFGPTHLDKVLASDDDRAALYNRLNAYQSFANGYGCALDRNGGNAGVKEHIFAPGLTLRIVGLNSALICCGKENVKKPKLLLGAKQRIIPELDDIEYMVLVHHPTRWLRDGEETQRYIDNRARVLLCGHEHRPKVTPRIVEGNGKILLIDAGATVPDVVTEDYTYTFNVVDIDLADSQDAIEVTVDVYKWNQKDKRFHSDTSEHVDGAPLCHSLPCPKFAAASARTRAAPERIAVPALAAGAPSASPELPVEAIDLAPSDESCEDKAVAYARARSAFFHQLGTAKRLAVLVKLKAIPEGIETLNSNLMLRQLDRLHRDGRTAELAAAIKQAEQED